MVAPLTIVSNSLINDAVAVEVLFAALSMPWARSYARGQLLPKFDPSLYLRKIE